MPNVLGNTRKPDVFFRKDGRIDITASASKLLNLEAGDCINIWSDESGLYLYATKPVGQHRAVCRIVNKRSRYLRASCKELTDFINSVTGDKETHIPVGTPVHLSAVGLALPLITRLNLYRDDK